MLRSNHIPTTSPWVSRAGKTTMGVTCRSCAHENRMGASYCGNCAEPLTGGVTCPQCAAHNPSQQNFCNSCGSSLAGEKSTRTASIGRLVGAIVSTVSATPSSPGPAVDTSADNSLGPVQITHAAKLTLAVATTAVVGSILALTRLWGLGTTPEEILPGEQAFVLIARQIEIEGWIGLSHGVLDGALTGYAYVLAFWTALVGDEIGMVRLLSGIASLASVGVSYFFIAMLVQPSRGPDCYGAHGGRCLAADVRQAGAADEPAVACGGLCTLSTIPSPLCRYRRVVAEEPAGLVGGARRTQHVSRLCGDCVRGGSVVFGLRFYLTQSAWSAPAFWVSESRPLPFRRSSSACPSGRLP